MVHVAPPGEPVGNLALIPSSDTTTTGSSSTVDIELSGALDCSVEPATGGRIYLRTNRGELLGATASGEGLFIELDTAGDGTVSLSALYADAGGTAQLAAWTDSRAAQGATSVTFDGDSLRPTVWGQDPSGESSDLRDTITLTFSEELYSGGIEPENFALTSDSGEVVSITIVEQTAPAVVALSLSETIDAGAAQWTVTATDGLRDLNGNKLSGDWSGTRGDYSGFFGNTPDVSPVVTRCDPDAPAFRPDGDDGVDDESDQVDLSLLADAAPAWWMVSVFDGSEHIALDRFAGISAATTWTWDGRDSTQQVVANGSYTIRVVAIDSADNQSAPCETSVAIDNHAETE